MDRKYILIFFLILYSFKYINNADYFYQPEDVINFLNRESYNKSKLEEIKNYILQSLNETYAYYEIIKNPPQPSFDNRYYDKVDFETELNKVTTENKSLYKFYQDIISTSNKIKINSLITVTKNFYPILQTLNFFQPLNLNITVNNKDNKVELYGSLNEEYKVYFRNYSNISEIIINNTNIPIKTINGKNPFDYITELGIKYYNLSNPHATFNYKFIEIFNYKKNNLKLFPLDLDELTNFKVVYENDETFTTDFIIKTNTKIQTNSSENNVFINNKINQQKSLKNNYLLNEDSEKYLRSISEQEEFEWDYVYGSMIKCKADKSKKVNVYYILNFDSIKEEYINMIEQCILLFDENKNPIVFIINRGIENSFIISQYFLEWLSPLLTINYYGAYRSSYNLSIINNKNIYNAEKCDLELIEDLMNSRREIDFGNNIREIITKPFILNGQDIRKKINEIKSKLKNPRKPTEIIVFTNGLSFLSKSLFIKYLQYYGGGITVGYFANPNKKNATFDSCLSPSVKFGGYILNNMSDGYYNLNNKYKIQLEVPNTLTFYNPDNLTIPLEFDITPVDEIVDIYKEFREIYYSEYINIANKIFKKYENECNPKNKKLVKVDKECDKYFNNNYTHGGYECGEDGNWTDKCVPSYCDMGYIFNHNKKECVIDYCDEKNKRYENKTEENNINEEDNKLPFYIILIIIIVCIIILIILGIIIFKCVKTMKNRSQSNFESIAKFSLVLQDY